MTAHPRPKTPRLGRRIATTLGAIVSLGLIAVSAAPAQAASYPQITGEGSSWAGLAWLDFTANAGRQGVSVTYTPNGSSQGRDDFARQSSAAFADSEIPFKGDASDPTDTTTVPFSYGMLPIVAGGTAFMYNLPIGGSRFQGLQLDMATIAGIFSGQITNWNDPKIKATNPGVALPNHTIDVVVRSDGSGATAQFKLWMLRQFPVQYTYLEQHTGGVTGHASSYFHTGTLSNFISQNGSTGVTTYTQNTPYTIDYDEYSYALQAGYPVAKIKNAAGYYTLPTQSAVAVALIAAKINTNTSDPNYLSQDLSNVYTYGDPRAYPMSMYSYEIVPHQTNAVTSAAKGSTIAWVTTQALCEWQRDMGPLGYSPLPMNLVLAGLDQLEGVPGIDSATKTSIANTKNGVLQAGTNPCNNPTFQPGDDPSHNVLVDTAAFPAGCNAACQGPWKQAGKGVNSGPDFGKGTGTNNAANDNTNNTNNDADNNADNGGGQQDCDADTGVCTTADSAVAGGNVKPIPTVIASQAGWTAQQTLGLTVGLLMFLVLIVAPPVINLAARRRKPGNGR